MQNKEIRDLIAQCENAFTVSRQMVNALHKGLHAVNQHGHDDAVARFNKAVARFNKAIDTVIAKMAVSR